MLKKIKLSAFILFLFAGMQLSAQSFYKEMQSKDNIISIGIGPSFAYLDNGGQYRDYNFELKPSISASFSKRLTDRFEIKATGGVQWITSGGNPSTTATNIWKANNSSFTAIGSVYYFDVMPSMYLVPFGNHMNRSLFNFYGGFGLGVMHSSTEQTKSFNSEEKPGREKITTGYVPIRVGLSYSLGPLSDIALEGSMLASFTDNLDGNVGVNKYSDHLVQGQIVFRRYLFSTFDR
ncbi:hypothetical protein LV84_02268 [Algoriphagus ratkowskyi]|uniref:Outer membrane protein with beta-barrel domain n=1 Tax=Algoriphagus ratkowskyi TaxID=57028 RepID=A0A2W7R9T4_9BACT|nr:hypothetical protein [Algoriphagus ratkowskyi]PZX55906.1 hypothetical protein LV84_02268 [Algoriphagus ratkowskyi]TXD77274.1 hypothetical protein ESW18_13355 [Algoriphagus ratkowskyi]